MAEKLLICMVQWFRYNTSNEWTDRKGKHYHALFYACWRSI